MAYKYPSLRTTLPVAGYYARLDAGAAATDQFTAASAENGTLTNGATRVDDNGLAYLFDGVNDYITTSTISALTGITNVTVSCWVKVTVGTSTHIINRYYATNTDNGWGLVINPSGYPVFFGRESGALFIAATSSVAVASNTWTHIAGTKVGNVWKVWVNGVERGSTTAGIGTTAFMENPLMIGAIPVFSSYGQSYVDDITIYATGLSATDIVYLASQRGAIYQQVSAGGLINGQSLVRPAGDYRPQSLVVM